jgi:two-component system chemotaxis sensor kinase CheA
VTVALAAVLEPDAAPSEATDVADSDARDDAAAEGPETPAAAGTPPAASQTLADDPELVREFIESSREHLDDADASLLKLEQDKTDTEAVGAVFRSFHTIKGMAGFLGLRAVEDTAHEAEDTLDGIRKGTLALGQEAMDSLFDAVDTLRGLIAQTVVPGESAPATAPGVPAAATGAQATAAGAMAPTAFVRSSVHVDEERLDLLLETIGELVIAEASVSQAVASLPGAAEAVVARLSRLDKISRQLQDMSTSMRMVSFGTTMRRMARLVRDLARESGKPVQCVLEGEEIELDKHVVEGMTDSLVHLVRNAVDHGVETDPEERVRAGKPRAATVRISARHASGRIVIDVQDDGRGIDPDAVIARAREIGILGPEETPAPEAVAHLLFTPGFSTSRTVTGVSGRGVGMDVVKRTAEALMGTVALTSSPGEGTTVRLTLPLTLAIIDGMLVRVGDERYIIPALAIVRSQRLEPGSLTGVLGRSEMLATPQGLVPIIRLRDLFAGGAADPGREDDGGPDDICTIVAAADGSAFAGLVVTELLGQHQIVMKSLGAGLGDVTGVSGAAILADGTVGLVIDVQQTVRIARGGKE